MSGMNVPEELENSISVTNAIPKDTSRYFSYGKGPYKCFRITLTGFSQCNSYQTDIKFIELYGTIYPDNKFEATKCLNKNYIIRPIISLITLTAEY